MHTHHFPVLVGIADKQPDAVIYAIAEAERLKRPLRVVHCWVLPTPAAAMYVGSRTLGEMRVDGQVVLDDARAIVDELGGGLEAEYLMGEGSPLDVLAEQAKQAAVLVLGSDDVPWYDRLLGGEISGYLARMAACPVVVVPERNAPGTGVGGVVVTIDGDTSAEGPLRYAFEQADARHEALHVLHAAPGATLRTDFQNHHANVAEIIAGWQEIYPDVEILRSTTDGAPVDECIEATAEASLVVIGRHHGHSTPFPQVRPIAMTVLRKAQCPVAVVPLDYGQA
jgi:nucleotide-binding universal stress UspA family protein